MSKTAPSALLAVDGDLLLALLQTRGNARLRLAAALVYEADLTFEMICLLTPTSFNLMGHEVGIRDASGEVVDASEIGEDTLREFFAWMSIRSEHILDGHYGLLLHDDAGVSLTPRALHAEFEQVLCRPGGDDEPRLEHFSAEMLKAVAVWK